MNCLFNMDKKETNTYEIAGVKIQICFSDTKLEKIINFFFNQFQIQGSGDYTIIFQSSGYNKENIFDISREIISEFDANEKIITMELKEGFHLIFLQRQNMLFSIYSEEIFNGIQYKNDGYRILYDNSIGSNTDFSSRSIGALMTMFWLLERLNIFRLHAAFVEYEGVDILLAGRGAVGKTSTALNIALNGGNIFCDDQVFFKKKESGEIHVYPGSNKIAITEQTIDLFPRLSEYRTIGNKWLEKYRVELESIFPSYNGRNGIPQIILFPFILNNTDQYPRTVKISAYEGYIFFLQGEILYPTISNEHRMLQLDLIEKLTHQAKLYSIYNCADMKKNFQLFKDTILFEGIAENVVS